MLRFSFRPFVTIAIITQLLIGSVCYSNITWINKVGVTTTSTSITKIPGSFGWNAGATSVEALTGNGYLEFKKGLNKAVMIGLSKGNSSSDYTDIDYALYLAGGNQIMVFESGANKGQYGSFAASDVFRVEVIGSTIKYLKNDSVFYTSTKPISFPLNIDTSLHYPNSIISDISLVSSTSPPPPAQPMFMGEVVKGIQGQDIDVNEFSVNSIGNTLILTGNTWKAINYSYTVTSNTVLQFDFRSSGQEPEINGIGFTNSLSQTPLQNRGWQVHGTQNWTEGITHANYSGDSWVSYTVPIGRTFTGHVNYMVFVGDDDGVQINQSSQYRNPKLVEVTSTQPPNFAPTLSSPSGAITDTTPTFSWSSVSTATGYKLKVKNTATNSNVINTTISGTTYTQPTALAVANYYSWTVTAYNADGDGPISTAKSFSITSTSSGGITWENKMGVTTTSTSITKTGTSGWNAGATSVQALTGNGYLEFTKGPNKAVMIGLSKGNSSSSFTDIDYAIYLNGSNNYYVYESGSYKGNFGSFTANDVFRVKVVGSTIKYLKNGTAFYTSTKPVSFPLNIDTSLHYPNSTISNIFLLTESQFPSGLITVSSPGCTISPNNSTCNTSVTWNASNAPNAALFIGYNNNYWTDVIGTKTYFNTTTTPVTFYLRVDKNNSNSQILAQADIYAENYIVPYSLYKGGSNFNWYSHGMQTDENNIRLLFPYGIIKNYHLSNVRDTTQTLLEEMYTSGQRRLRIGVYHARDIIDSGSIGTVINSSQKQNKADESFYHIEQVYLNNLLNYLNDVKNYGFEEVLIGMFPIACNSPYTWRKYYYLCENDINATFDGDIVKEYSGEGVLPLWLENWNVIKEVVNVANLSGINYSIDLGNERVPNTRIFDWSNCVFSGIVPCDTTMPINERELYQNRWENFLGVVWSEYLSNYGNTKTVGYSFSIGNVADILSKSDTLADIYGRIFPKRMSFHIYDRGDEINMCGESSKSAYCKYKAVAQKFSNLDGIILGEVFYNDNETALELQKAIDDTGVTPDYILQWPLGRNPIYYNHPISPYENYYENGF